MQWLTKEEQDAFREDFRDKEKEIQRYIGVYLSGFVLVASWIVGPQSKPLLEMAVGNDGLNLIAILLVVVVNILFIIFLIYKSIIEHEITQFITFLSKPESAFNYWESWRRSPQSASRPVRTAYTVSLGVLPVIVSILIMVGIGIIIFGNDPAPLANKINASRAALIEELRGTSAQANPATLPRPIDPIQLAPVFTVAQVLFVLVGLGHLVPFVFLYHNVKPTNKRWDEIKRMRGSDSLFNELNEYDPPGLTPPQSAIRIYDHASNECYGEVTEEQLKFLSEKHAERFEAGSVYYLDQRTLEMFESSNADAGLLEFLRRALGQKDDVDLTWVRSRSRESNAPITPHLIASGQPVTCNATQKLDPKVTPQIHTKAKINLDSRIGGLIKFIGLTGLLVGSFCAYFKLLSSKSRRKIVKVGNGWHSRKGKKNI